MTECDKLLDFINKSPTSFQATENIVNLLIKNNYKQLDESDKWIIEKGGKYFVTKNNSAVIGFEIGSGNLEEEGFRLISSHTDSPCFKVKPSASMYIENNYLKLNTEVYGGPILSSWFDRPLSFAGRVVLKSENILSPRQELICMDKALLIIPNLAIHFNREINESYSINKQIDTLPIVGFINDTLEKEDYILNILADKLNVKKEEILDFELYLYEFEKGKVVGLNNEFFSSSRLDDLWMVFSSSSAFVSSGPTKSTKVLVLLDNEEVGNQTAEGANSNFLQNTLNRIALSLNKSNEDFFRAISKSVMVSADLAHGVHPNHIDKHDPTNRPVLSKGTVIKYSSSKKYSTNSISAAIFIAICQKENIKYQTFVNRSDLLGGSTMGPSFATNLTIPVIDMGAPILSMHSVRELGAVSDIIPTEKFFKSFFEA